MVEGADFLLGLAGTGAVISSLSPRVSAELLSGLGVPPVKLNVHLVILNKATGHRVT
jgi:hypothetical protein